MTEYQKQLLLSRAWQRSAGEVGKTRRQAAARGGVNKTSSTFVASAKDALEGR